MVNRIDYIIEDSFDAEVKEHKIYPMSGTGIEKDFIILNTFGVPHISSGLLQKPIQIDIDYNPEWKIGTALEKENGYYLADSYYHLGGFSNIIRKSNYCICDDRRYSSRCICLFRK